MPYIVSVNGTQNLDDGNAKVTDKLILGLDARVQRFKYIQYNVGILPVIDSIKRSRVCPGLDECSKDDI